MLESELTSKDRYGWVHSEVKMEFSLHDDRESIAYLR